jgi:hypothetical protein
VAPRVLFLAGLLLLALIASAIHAGATTSTGQGLGSSTMVECARVEIQKAQAGGLPCQEDHGSDHGRCGGASCCPAGSCQVSATVQLTIISQPDGSEDTPFTVEMAIADASSPAAFRPPIG